MAILARLSAAHDHATPAGGTASPVASPRANEPGPVFEASMESLKFVPAEIEDRSRDDPVTWTNNDTVTHTVGPTRSSSKIQLFGSPFLTPGQTFSYTFDKPGTYPVYCLPHPFMTQTVVVSEKR